MTNHRGGVLTMAATVVTTGMVDPAAAVAGAGPGDGGSGEGFAGGGSGRGSGGGPGGGGGRQRIRQWYAGGAGSGSERDWGEMPAAVVVPAAADRLAAGRQVARADQWLKAAQEHMAMSGGSGASGSGGGGAGGGSSVDGRWQRRPRHPPTRMPRPTPTDQQNASVMLGSPPPDASQSFRDDGQRQEPPVVLPNRAARTGLSRQKPQRAMPIRRTIRVVVRDNQLAILPEGVRQPHLALPPAK